MEGQAERLVHLLTTLASIEELLLNEVANSEQRAASSIGSGVLAIRTSNAAREGSLGSGLIAVSTSRPGIHTVGD